MKKNLIFLAIFSLLMGVTADRINLRNGELLENVTIQEMTKDKVILQSGKEIPTTEVSEIGFGSQKETKKEISQNVTNLSYKEQQKYQKYFKIGKNLAAKFPGTDYVHIIDVGYSRLKSDGTRIYTYHFLGYVTSPKAKTDLSKMSFFMAEERYKSTLNIGRTITEDGKVYNFDPNNFKIVTPQAESWSYGNSKRRVYTIPNVEEGRLVEYKYSMNNFAPTNPKIFEPEFYFQGDVPVYFSKYSVSVPRYLKYKDKDKKNVFVKNVFLNYKAYNMGKFGKPKIAKKQYSTGYTWTMKNMPPYVEEPQQKNIEDFLPNIQGTIFKDRKELDNWIGGMEKERMKVTPEITKTVQEITDQKDDPEIKLAKIYHWLQTHIEYTSVKGSISSGITGHPAIETLNNRKGDCIDKAILFATMVKALNIPDLKAYPVTVKSSSSEDMIVDIPVIDGNHAITEVHFKDNIFYLDSTASSYRYPSFRGDDKGIYAVNEILNTVRKIEVPEPEYEMNFYDINININKKGVFTGKTVGKYTGDYEAGLRGLYTYRKGEKEREAIFKNMVNGMSPKGVLVGYKISDVTNYFEPFFLTYSYNLYDYPTTAGKYMIFKVPGWNYRFPAIELKTRKYPIEFWSSRYTGHKYEIKIPNGYVIKYLPESLDIKTDDFEYHGKFDFKDGKITLVDNYKRYNRIIAPEHYEKYRTAHLKILNYANKSIIIKKK